MGTGNCGHSRRALMASALSPTLAAAIGRAALLAVSAFIASPALAQNGLAQLEEVVVTAQKREQNLQDVPIAVTALTETALRANRIVDIRDLNAVAPNVTVRTLQGGSSGVLVSVRGLVTAGSALGSDKGLSQYIDGVYLQNTAASIFELADIERIEVLKGPQGTLFGRNATGGAINITTRRPSGKLGLHQELTYGNYNQIRSKSRLDLPQVGPVSATLTYVHSERDGDVKNLGAGAIWDWNAGGRGFRLSPKRLGDQDVDAFFAAVQLDLAPDFEVTYKFDWVENNFTPEPSGIAFVDSAVITGIRAGQDPSLMTPISNKRPDALNNWFTTPSKAYASGHNLTVRYRINDQLSIKNILSKRRSGTNATFQLDGLGGIRFTPFMSQIGLGGAFGQFLIGQPWILIGNVAHQNDRQWSNELQVNWNTELFDLTAGYIHFEYKTAGAGFSGLPSVLTFSPAPGFIVPGFAYKETTIHTKSDALFVQVEGHVTSKIDVIGGYRITRDKKHGVDNTALTAANASITLPISYEKSRPTYLAGINFHPTDDILTYAKYTTGFISGGQLASRTYGPETAESFELGIKADLLDRRLRSNLALFDVRYGKLQLQTSGLNLIPPINAAVVLVNAGDAKAKGFEWENTLIPIDGLTLTANLGYTDFKYTNVDPVIGTLQTFLPIHRPKWTAAASVQYDTGEVYAGGHVSFRVDANYRGKTLLGTSPSLNQAALAAVTTKNSWIVNGRIALVDFDVAGARTTAALWGRNIFNNKQLMNATGFQLGALGAVYGAMYERARTFGVDLSLDF
jgi:iron complex outermembrane receptor protein